jgi:hypothetical protein
MSDKKKKSSSKQKKKGRGGGETSSSRHNAPATARTRHGANERISYGSLFDIDTMNFNDKEVAEEVAGRREEEDKEEGW